MYSVNQVKHLYVVSKVNDPGESGSASLAANDPVGTLAQQTSADGWFMFFKYIGNGGVITTDRIKKRKVKWVSYNSAASLRKNKRKVVITMNSGVNNGAPVIGQDYIINFAFKNYFGMSDEDTYEKYASARAFSNNASDLLINLAISAAKNFSREVDMPFTITAGGVEVTPTTKKEDFTGTVSDITLTEVEQPWNLGRMKQTRPDYKVHFVPVVVDNLERYDWGTATVTEVAANGFIGNGKETADLEWFCMGERGDQYRGKDWPLSITTPDSLLVNPAKEYNYLTIHFWDDIDNEGPQKSERDMVFVADSTNNVALNTIAVTVATFAGLDHYIADGVATSI